MSSTFFQSLIYSFKTKSEHNKSKRHMKKRTLTNGLESLESRIMMAIVADNDFLATQIDIFSQSAEEILLREQQNDLALLKNDHFSSIESSHEKTSLNQELTADNKDILSNYSEDHYQIIGVLGPVSGFYEIIPGDQDAGTFDKISFISSITDQKTTNLTFILADQDGNQFYANTQIDTQSSGTVLSYGEINIGGNHFALDPRTIFSPATSGTYTTTLVVPESSFEYTSDEGVFTGTQSINKTIVSNDLGNGNWTYSEVVTWSYCVNKDDKIITGGYSYEFESSKIGVVSSYTFNYEWRC